MGEKKTKVPGPWQLMALHVLQLVGKALEASVASRSPTRELSTRGAPTNQGVQQHQCLLVVLDGVPLKETSTASTSMALLETHGNMLDFATTLAPAPELRSCGSQIVPKFVRLKIQNHQMLIIK